MKPPRAYLARRLLFQPMISLFYARGAYRPIIDGIGLIDIELFADASWLSATRAFVKSLANGFHWVSRYTTRRQQVSHHTHSHTKSKYRSKKADFLLLSWAPDIAILPHQPLYHAGTDTFPGPCPLRRGVVLIVLAPIEPLILIFTPRKWHYILIR